jgi:hypothetical protein
VIINPEENSNRLGLPYILPAQAQKHVTVNEALRKLDGIVQLSLQSPLTDAPPENPVSGASYFIASGAAGAWAHHGGQIATWQDDGWIFVAPQLGWRAYLLNQNVLAIFDGSAWVPLQAGSGSSTASDDPDRLNMIGGLDLVIKRATLDLNNANKIDVPFRGILPSHHMVIGMTIAITETVAGSTMINIGDNTSSYRFATRMGVAAGTQAIGLCNPPYVYWSNSDVYVRTGNARTNENMITGGKIDVVVYMLTLQYPLG